MVEDKDNDGAWSEKELDDFAIFMKTQPFSAEEKADIKDNFDLNDKQYGSLFLLLSPLLVAVEDDMLQVYG